MNNKITVIKNEYMKVSINHKGAEITSIKSCDGKELIHQSEPVWENSAPVLFPICGRPIEGKIIVDSAEYPAKIHGFAMDSDFVSVVCEEKNASFILESNAETKKLYPFDFKLVISYSLSGNSLCVKYEVENTGNNEMHFSIGSHEGYVCSGGLDGYEIHFEKEEITDPVISKDGHVPEKHLSLENGHTVLTLDDELFEDAVTVCAYHTESKSVSLVKRGEGEKVRVDFKDFPNLFIWTNPGREYVCIEPWCGRATKPDDHPELKYKKDIISIQPGAKDERVHTVTFIL